MESFRLLNSEIGNNQNITAKLTENVFNVFVSLTRR